MEPLPGAVKVKEEKQSGPSGGERFIGCLWVLWGEMTWNELIWKYMECITILNSFQLCREKGLLPIVFF